MRKSFQERMYEQGFIISDYERCKPLCDEIDRLEKYTLEHAKTISVNAFHRISRQLQHLRREALAYFARNPLGHPKPKHPSHAN